MPQLQGGSLYCRRWALLLFVANVVCYVDRINISVAVVVMRQELGWSSSEEGLVLSAFFVGYMLTQVLGGWLAQGHGGTRVLAVGVAGWSVFTICTPLAARTSFALLIACRVLMGCFEGLAIPAIHAVIGRRATPNDRSRAVTFITSGQLMGTILALSTSPLAAQSWQLVFFVFGGVGLCFVPALVLLMPAAPVVLEDAGADTVALVNVQDGQGSRSGDSPGAAMSTDDDGGEGSAFPGAVGEQHAPPSPLGSIAFYLRQPACLAVFAAHACHNYGYYVFLSWLPEYLLSLGIQFSHSGAVAIIPYVCMQVFDVLWGRGADFAIERRVASTLAIRRLSQAVAFAIPSCVLVLLAVFGSTFSVPVAMAALTVAMTTTMASHSGYWSNIVDLAPEESGLLCGISNTIGTIPGIVGNAVTGAILESTGGRWEMVFVCVIACYTFGLVVFASFSRAHQLRV